MFQGYIIGLNSTTGSILNLKGFLDFKKNERLNVIRRTLADKNMKQILAFTTYFKRLLMPVQKCTNSLVYDLNYSYSIYLHNAGNYPHLTDLTCKNI